MSSMLLAISNDPDSLWLRTLGDALRSVAELQVASEQDALTQVRRRTYALILVDATATAPRVAELIAELHGERPAVPIVVATTSPTWQRARQAFLAGASDYVRKSLDMRKTVANLCELLGGQSPHRPY